VVARVHHDALLAHARAGHHRGWRRGMHEKNVSTR
jgi:hypothetical protein